MKANQCVGDCSQIQSHMMSTSKRRHSLLLSAFLLACVILVTILGFVEPARRPLSNILLACQARFQGWFYTQWWEIRWSKDPKIGQRLAIPSSLQLLLPQKASMLCEVIFLGSCSDSAIRQLRTYLSQQLSAGRTSYVVVVVKCKPSLLKRNLGKVSENLHIYYDQEGYLHLAWNAFFIPRRYLITCDGTLISLQKQLPLGSVGGGCECERKTSP